MTSTKGQELNGEVVDINAWDVASQRWVVSPVWDGKPVNIRQANLTKTTLDLSEDALAARREQALARMDRNTINLPICQFTSVLT